MIPHNMTLFKFICVQYQFHRQTLPIMKIDRGQIQFRDYVSTGTEPMLQSGLELETLSFQGNHSQPLHHSLLTFVNFQNGKYEFRTFWY